MNLNEEVRNGYLITSEMKKVWNIQMEICKKIFEVCDKHNLRIVCSGGTAIGVLREHGYIPWDDDIDLEMLREDYDKLCSVAKDEFKEPYFFQNAYTDKGYCYGHAQVRKSGTSAILRGDVFKKNHLGIFVDIFILDNVPENTEKLAQLKNKVVPIQNALFFKSFCHLYTSNPISYIKACIKHFPYLPIPLKTLYRKYESQFRKVASSGNVCTLAFTWNSINYGIRPKSMMDHIEWLPFEDMLMPVPDKCAEILTRQYGDFMKPAKAPSMHGGFLVLDSEHDYRTYLPELRKQEFKRKLNKILSIFGLKKYE